jgi:hypothetical protein
MMQLALYGLAGGLVVLFAGLMGWQWWSKRPAKAVAVADDIPELIAAAKLAQSVGCQKGVDAMLGVVASRLAVSGTNPVPAEVK